MDRNDILITLDGNHKLSPDAKMIAQTLDTLVSALIGRLIAERLIEYAGQPGQTIEYAAGVIGDVLVEHLDKVDTVELKRFWDRNKTTEGTR